MAKWASLIAIVLLLPRPASAGSVTVRFEGGLVTITAANAPLRDVLAEWSRQGGTRFVNAEKIAGAPVTLELVQVPEKQALEVLLRSVAGYVAAPRMVMAGGTSAFDRIVVMPTSSAPLPAPARSAVRPPVFQPPAPPAMDVDDGETPNGPIPGGPPGLSDMPEDPDEQPTSPQVPPFPQGQPGPGQGVPEGAQQPPGADPNAPVATPPPTPGPTPLPSGVVTQPTPGLVPQPAQKPPQ